MLFGKKLSTEPYKGVRDFYPEDKAIQRYIFDIWSETAESFGYEPYDASVLEPAELYRSKTSDEIVNEQTYTFIDRGEREVTLRPEMTPTVARMIAGKRRDLTFPVRWYSIPNLFRYERPQRGRLREHWQLNCDIFGADDYSADVEIISLAYHMLLNFGAEPSMFEIRVNNRALMESWYVEKFKLTAESIKAITRLVDRKNKVSAEEFKQSLKEVVDDTDALIAGLGTPDPATLSGEHSLQAVIAALKELGITNVRFDASLARGFDYYTGTIFEIFDTSSENNRSLLGGGRYDNLTALFGGDKISGIGFGMGDVTMRDFLETHGLLTNTITTAPVLMVVPTEAAYNIEGQKVAEGFRAHGIATAVDISSKKIGKKISDASGKFVEYILVVGENEVQTQKFTLKHLESGKEYTGELHELAHVIDDTPHI